MSSSNSEQKYHADKSSCKKYQKFKSKQGQGTRSSVGNLKSDRKDINSTAQSNLKEELSRKLNESNGFKSDKPRTTGNTKENEKKFSDTGPDFENLRKNKDLCKRKDKLSQPTSTNAPAVLSEATSEGGAQKESHSEFVIVSKANSSKVPPAEPYRNPYKKKRTAPLLISFQDILSRKRANRKTREQNISKTKAERLRHKEVLSGNLLDSSNPKRSRGKHREIKKKKLSKLKLMVIKERIIKHKMREMGDNGSVEWVNLIDKIDFNTEIKAYLNDLQNKKLKNSQNYKSKTENLSKIKTPEEKQVEKENIHDKTENSETAQNEVKEKERNVNNICKLKGKKISEVNEKEEIKFSSKFREYCDNIITPELNSAVMELIKGLINLQDRLFLRDPIKAKVKRRHTSGIREVRKYLTLKKVKMIIIAPNLEKLKMEGSIYESIEELKSMANSQGVPYGFALDRYKLGRCTKKFVPVSAFAILSYEGIEGLYENALHQLMEAKNKFSELIKVDTDGNHKKEDENSRVIASLIVTFLEGLQVSKEDHSQQDSS